MISRIEEASNGHLLVITSLGFMEWDGVGLCSIRMCPAGWESKPMRYSMFLKMTMASLGTARRQVLPDLCTAHWNGYLPTASRVGARVPPIERTRMRKEQFGLHAPRGCRVSPPPA
jgi:hypothetical protein